MSQNVCQLPVGNTGKMCGYEVQSRIRVINIEELAVWRSQRGMGDYARHLIAQHWDLLVKVRSAYENGEIQLEVPT